MKRAKTMRTLEELWDLEDQYPLVDASAGGLLRWMLATGMLATPSSAHRTRANRPHDSARRAGHGRS